MLDRTTPWAVAFAFVLLVTTAGAATQKTPMFASVGAGLDVAGTEASAEAEASASAEVRAPDGLVDFPTLAPRAPSRDSGDRNEAASSNGTGGSGGTGGNGSEPPANETPQPPPTRPGNGTSGGNGTMPVPSPERAPRLSPELSPEAQNATGSTRTTLRFDVAVTNPDATAQEIRLNVIEPAGWSVALSDRELTLEPGERRVVEGRAVTLMSTGGRATIVLYAKGEDAQDRADVHVCARGIFVDLCEPATATGSDDEPANATSGDPATNATNGEPPTNATSGDPATNESQGTPANETNSTPPANETPSNGSTSSSPAPTPPPQSPPPPPPSNSTSTAPASPPTEDEESDADAAWVDAEVGAEGEASSDGLRVEV